MLGIECLHALNQDAMAKLFASVWQRGLYDLSQMEDMVLATDEGRVDLPDIGTSTINLSTVNYVLENPFWISVCLYVNADFRACFNDAIMIEKALLQVNDIDYKDFREDMTLASSVPEGKDAAMRVRLDGHNPRYESAFVNKVNSARAAFFDAGMTEAYDELAATLTDQEKEEVQFTIHNMLYVCNAMNWNGVFNKYVRLVVESVKSQLGAKKPAAEK